MLVSEAIGLVLRQEHDHDFLPHRRSLRCASACSTTCACASLAPRRKLRAFERCVTSRASFNAPPTRPPPRICDSSSCIWSTEASRRTTDLRLHALWRPDARAVDLRTRPADSRFTSTPARAMSTYLCQCRNRASTLRCAESAGNAQAIAPAASYPPPEHHGATHCAEPDLPRSNHVIARRAPASTSAVPIVAAERQ